MSFFTRTDHASPPRDVLTYYNRIFREAFKELEVVRLRGTRSHHLFATTDEAVEALEPSRRAGLFTLQQAPQILGLFLMLAAWRPTQRIFRFDASLAEMLADTEFSGTVPAEVLTRIPVWGLFVELPEFNLQGEPCNGFWFYFEQQPSQATHVMRFVFNTPRLGHAVSIDVAETLEDGYRLFEERAAANTDLMGYAPITPTEQRMLLEDFALARRMMNLVLYLCSEEPDVSGDGPWQNFPAPRKTKKGMRLFAPEQEDRWLVGERIGAALRLHDADAAVIDAGAQDADDAPGRRVKPHVRRAHWHKYRTGPRDGQGHWVVKWLQPVFVKVRDVAELPTVTSPVDASPRHSAPKSNNL